MPSKYRGTPTYNSWHTMKQRCRDKKHMYYRLYGGRGIKVCARWLEPRDGFLNFIADMGLRPKGLTLDRIDRNGNYEPRNCRWADRLTQSTNSIQTRFLEFAGKRLTLSAWARETGIGFSCLWNRLDAGWSIRETLSIPPSKANRRAA